MVEEPAFVFGSHSARFDRNEATAKRIMINGRYELTVSRAAVHAMQKALEKAGVQFIAKNGGGPGVRLQR